MISQRVSPFDLIARVLSERLRGRAASDELRAMASSPSIDWERVVGLASDQYVLPAFAAALRDLDLIGSLDHGLGAFLEAVHAANLERNSELRDELATAVGALNRAGIEPVLLKGAIRLCDGRYPDDGWRMLRDLDLLVRESEWADALRALARAGYDLAHPADKGVPLRRRGAIVQIDLHRELFSTPRRERLLRGVEVLDAARPAVLGEAVVRLPSMMHQAVHLIGHCQIQDYGLAQGRITFRDLLEAAALTQWGSERVDWQAVSARFAAAGYRRPLLTFLLSLNDSLGCSAPVPCRVDLLAALQRRRIALQARSTSFAYLSSRAGWWYSELRSQIEERDAGRPRAIKNLERLIFERGAILTMVRSFIDRQRRMLYVIAQLGWLVT